MKTLRTILGFTALLGLAIGFNFLVIQEALLAKPVLISLGVGAGATLLWGLLHLALLAGAKTESAAAAFNTILASLFFLGCCIVVYLFVRRMDYSVDLTDEGRRDLAPQTVQVLQALTEPVNVTCFFVRSGNDRSAIAQEKTQRFLDRCQVHTNQLVVEYVDPQMHPERVQESRILGLEKSRVGTVLLESGARRRELPFSDIHARMEERDFTNALINVARESAPKIYFLAGHGGKDLSDQERSSRKGGFVLAVLLMQEGYDVAELIIDPGSPHIPSDCAAIIVNGYDADLTAAELDAFDQYAADGGRFLVMADVQYIERGKVSGPQKLQPWIESRFGLKLNLDIVLRASQEPAAILFHTEFGLLGTFPDFEEPDDAFRGSYNTEHVISRSLDKLLRWELVRSVVPSDPAPEGITTWPLLRSTPDTWAESDVQSAVTGGSIAFDADEYPGPVIVAAAASRSPKDDDPMSRGARMVVFGNADMSSNASLTLVANQDLLLNSAAWLTENEDLIAIRPSMAAQEPILLSERQQRVIIWIAGLGVLQCIVVFGMAALWLRRRTA